MSLKYFGTDGIRGEYGGPLLNNSMAFRAGKAAARIAKKRYGIEEPILLVGRDTRESGTALENALICGFASEGGRGQSLGVASTPAIAYLCSNGPAHFACAITASHNPYADNGLKFFTTDGIKPDADLEQELDDAIGEISNSKISLGDTASVDASDSVSDYANAVIAQFQGRFLAGKKIALDCANGASYAIAPKVFEALGATIDLVGATPDGTNINRGVGSECPDSLLSMYRDNRYDFGFAFDGDGDRLIAFDEDGNKLSGEAVMSILAIGYKNAGKLQGGAFVTTFQSNLGLDTLLANEGVLVERVDIGDKFIARKLIEANLLFGGEESGHVINGDFAMTGDGLFAALRLAESSIASGVSLGQAASSYKAFPQESKAVRVLEKRPLESCAALQAQIAILAEEFGSEGRMLIRYSGTEPKLRLLVEAKSDAIAASAMASLLQAVRADLEVAQVPN